MNNGLCEGFCFSFFAYDMLQNYMEIVSKFKMISPVLFMLLYNYYARLSLATRHTREQNNKHWIEKVLNETFVNYDNRIIPLESGEPLKLELRIFLLNLAELEPSDSHFTTELILHSSWIDHRLKFSAPESNSYRITGDVITSLWTPDIVFASEKGGRRSVVTRSNILGKISSSGKIVISERYYIKHYCNMDFFFYPFDEQICEINLMSYAYSQEWLNASWIVENPVRLLREAKISGKFYLVDFETQRTFQDYQKFGYYDRLMLRMKLRRRDTALVLRIYVPLTVMVVVSWFCFLIDYQSVPARTSMSAALVLTVMTLIANIHQDLPKATTVRVVDIHMFVCFLYIFAGLVEYSFIRSIVIGSSGAIKQQQQRKGNSKNSLQTQPSGHARTVRAINNWKRITEKLRKEAAANIQEKKGRHPSLRHVLQKICLRESNGYHALDRISIVCFPVSFAIYCIAYFYYVKYGQ